MSYELVVIVSEWYYIVGALRQIRVYSFRVCTNYYCKQVASDEQVASDDRALCLLFPWIHYQ